MAPRTPSRLDLRRRRQFGDSVRRLRLAAGLSQEALAERADLHRNYVGFIERAERNVTVTTVWRLADALEVPVSDLLSRTT